MRRSGETAADNSVNDSGMISAAPTPWTARANTNHPTVGDTAAAADATVNSVSPDRNIRRLPNRSPRAAPVSRSTAKVRV